MSSPIDTLTPAERVQIQEHFLKRWERARWPEEGRRKHDRPLAHGAIQTPRRHAADPDLSGGLLPAGVEGREPLQVVRDAGERDNPKAKEPNP